MSKSIPFRVQSHVLKLLGDQLIGHDRLAVFELVKNSYDADATVVDITLNLDSENPSITVEDNGNGMSSEIIESAWLVIGTDSKRSLEKRLTRTFLGRMPLGEKGVGRLAVQKLGDELSLLTKTADEEELEFNINWTDLVQSSRYLGDGLKVELHNNSKPKIFKNKNGTKISISKLHNPDWSRREIRDLYRLITSLSNPFDNTERFVVNLHLPNREDEVHGLPTLQQMIDSAVWNFEFELNEEGIFTWTYKFTPPRFKGLLPRTVTSSEKLQLLETDNDDAPIGSMRARSARDDKIFLTPADLRRIGPITGRFHAFHRRDEILKASGASQQMKKWLDNQTGVRVYRDNIRVFNYGEPGEDWLGLDARRINRPTGKLGTQSVIAQISLDLEKSNGLKEKTNREGFDDNPNFRRLRRIVLSIFDRFQREHETDRSAIDQALKGDDQTTPAPLQIALDQLKTVSKQHHLENEIKPVLQSIQQELNTFRDVMLSSGLAGMNLALVFHEVVHNIDRIQLRLKANAPAEEIKNEIDHLRKLLDTFKPLLQRDKLRKVTAIDLVDRAVTMHEDRFKRHEIILSNWVADPKKGQTFSQLLPRGLMVAALSNIIDNSIYWTRFRQERDGRNTKNAILIMSRWDEESGGTIAIVDNGPGLQISAEQVGRPFSSTRAGGMGLGLFYCKTVMESTGGDLRIVHADELREEFDFPTIYDGAAVIFSFKADK